MHCIFTYDLPNLNSDLYLNRIWAQAQESTKNNEILSINHINIKTSI